MSAFVGPEIEVLDGTMSIADGGTVDFGTTGLNVPVNKVLTVRNVGTENLTLTSLNTAVFPTGYSLVSDLGTTVLAPESSTTFTVRLYSSSAGTFSGPISLGNNVADENPFDLFLTGSVTGSPAPIINQLLLLSGDVAGSPAPEGPEIEVLDGTINTSENLLFLIITKGF